jgi:hypothetical protein
MDEIIQELDSEFELSDIPFAVEMLRKGLNSAFYNSEIDVVWHHNKNLQGNGATMRIIARGGLPPHAKCTADRHASGTLEWWTSRNHYVRIAVEKDGDQPIVVTDVALGNDPSEVFYPTINNLLDNCQRIDPPPRPQ